MLNIPGYHITKRIYRSDRTSVYRALREKDKRAVVLKILQKTYPPPEEIARYRHEYEILRHLADAEGVIKPYSIAQHQKKLVMVLEDCGGQSLAKWLGRKHHFTVAELLTLAARITAILGRIHDRHVIHKDINPSNIIYDPDSGIVKIIDFGISTQLSQQYPAFINPDAAEGSLAYMSPEQTGRMNRHLDYRTDFYSLGAAFYEIFTGAPPFTATDPMELFHLHIAKKPVPPQHIKPDLPPLISDIIMKLLEKEAEARYIGARGIEADLEECRQRLSKTGRIDPFTLAQNDIPDRFQISSKLYGRESEKAAFLAAFARASEGEAEIILIGGYSGIGKSMLVKEVYRSLTEKKGYFVSGKSDQLRRDVPLNAIVDAFRKLIRQILTETGEQLALWKQRLLAALGPNGPIIGDVIPEIELVIGSQPKPPQLGPAESRNRFNQVFENFINVFCAPERPLVLFLDDLQWVDPATLKLLELIMANGANTGLLLIGAYRDNEIDPTHVLMRTIDRLHRIGAAINTITLNPLSLEAINQLIADSLRLDAATVGPLTRLVMHKTGGNPFFVNQFLRTLHEEGLLFLAKPAFHRKGAWNWDAERIKTFAVTANVVDLLIGKLKKLSPSTQHILRLAACVGHRFDLNTLSLIGAISAADAFEDLKPALSQGFILPLSEPEITRGDIQKARLGIQHFQFSHDRLQQAAYALIEDQRKRAVHLQIGRLLLKDASAETLEDNLFDIIEHFNYAIDLLDHPAERLDIARLNLRAGKKAKNATAYETAIRYFATGQQCLPANSWQTEYALTLDLLTEKAEAAYLVGDFQQMRRLAQSVIKHARALPDEVKVREIQILAYTSQGQYQEALQIALAFLNRLGMTFPHAPTPEDIQQAVQKIQVSLGDKPIHTLVDLPRMTSPDKIMAMRIMVAASNAAYHLSPSLMILFILNQVHLSLVHGNANESTCSYCLYGSFLCGVAGDIETGFQFGRLALKLSERLEPHAFEAKVLFYFNNSVRGWKEHVREVIQPMLDSYQIALQSGDLEIAAYSILVYPIVSFYSGRSLETLEMEMPRHGSAVDRLKQDKVLNWLPLFWQVILNLRGRSDNPCQLTGEVYDETVQLSLYQRTDEKTALFYIYFNKCILHYLFQEYTQALENAKLAAQNLEGVTALVTVAIFHFYESLAWLAAHPGLAQPDQDDFMDKVALNQEKLKQWALHAPMNHQHKYYLVEAERARVSGRDGEAREFYDQAIALAHANEYVNEEAMAHERAGLFYLDKGLERFTQVCFFEARYAYGQWGATAKVKHLESLYPQFLASPINAVHPADTAAQTGRTPSTDGSLERVDLNSILKAGQIIAGEIVLSRLLKKMMHIVIENAGAEKGVLLLPRKGRWFIQAQGHINHAHTDVLQSEPIEASEQAPANIIHFTARTRETVVLHDAAHKGRFTRDAYIRAHRSKSVLCLPLVHLGKLTGVLYLENNQTTAAFTPDRAEVLSLLSSQIAISIENSLLYNTLEQKVAERTRELEHEIVVRKEAEKGAQAANRAKSAFLANMSHELRTPLNAILGFTQLLAHAENLDPEQRKNLKTIRHSGKHLMALINQVLDLSRIEAGRVTLNETYFHLGRLLDEVESLFTLQARDKGLKLQFIRDPDTPRYVCTDAVKLRQVLINLLGNAMKFTQEGGVTLSVQRLPEPKGRSQGDALAVLCFEITDTGPGIAAHEMETLFEAFKQTETGRQSEQGSGLGLAISRNFAQRMRGALRVESQPGRGTTFILEIQAQTSESAVHQIPKETRQVVGLEPGQPRFRILITDDKKDNRLLLVNALKPLGFDLREAENGRRAVEIWEKWRPDLICMDMRMPVMNGSDAVQTIRARESALCEPKTHKALPRVVIIAISASAFVADRKIALDAGCDDFLGKPLQISDLMDRLVKHLGVRLVYRESAATVRAPQATDDNEILTAARLTALPQELTKALEHAAKTTNLRKAKGVIARIRKHDKPLADALAALLEKYRFDILLERLKTDG